MILPPTPENLQLAGAALGRGELVGMPTETVYGLAASLWNRDALRRTFAAKGRPTDNPLIVHVAHLEQLEEIVAEWPEDARRLAERFWPGPLTLVLPKRPEVPDEATGGLGTVAVRVPAHPVALRLIDAAGSPLTAPSANSFMGLSPTRAEHVVVPGLAVVLDGGPCAVGIESTVIGLDGDVPRLLRPGGVPRGQIEAALGRTLAGKGDVRRSPGDYPRHYAPRTPLRLADSLGPNEAGLTFDEPADDQIRLPRDPAAYGISMYAALHRLDAMGLEEIVVQAPPRTEAWEAVWDRLARATTESP